MCYREDPESFWIGAVDFFVVFCGISEICPRNCAPMSIITSKSVVGISYVLKGDDGKIIDQSDDNQPFVFLMGAKNIVPGLEKALDGKADGDELSVSLEPAEGYGEKLPTLIGEVPRSQFPEGMDIEIGMRFQGEVGGGMAVLQIVEVKEESVIVDANHELAGLRLNFDVKILSIREATEEETAHGHVHAEGGCCGGGGHEHSEGGCCGGDEGESGGGCGCDHGDDSKH